jgi:hypothetical protein
VAVSPQEVSQLTEEELAQANRVEVFCDNCLRDGRRSVSLNEPMSSFRVIAEIQRRYGAVGWNVTWFDGEFTFEVAVERRGEYDSGEPVAFGLTITGTNPRIAGGEFVDAVSKTWTR